MGRVDALRYTSRTSGLLRFDPAIYHSLLGFDGDTVIPDSSAYVAKFSRTEMNTSPIRIELHEGRFVVYNRLGINSYQPFCVVLRNGSPLACLGFQTQHDRVMEVRQIQGMPREQETLSRLHWESLLVNAWTDWGRDAGFTEARILPAIHNEWWDPTRDLFGDWFTQKELEQQELDAKTHQARMLKRYDETAENNGFTYDPQIERYRLSLV